MSADLLRRAAVRLREHAEAAPAGPWQSLDGGDRLLAIRDDEAPGYQYLVDEPVPNAATAAYFALMHPPVALALADVLDRAADVRQHEGEGTPEGGWAACIPKWIEPSLLALARAVLREPEGGA